MPAFIARVVALTHSSDEHVRDVPETTAERSFSLLGTLNYQKEVPVRATPVYNAVDSII